MQPSDVQLHVGPLSPSASSVPRQSAAPADPSDGKWAVLQNAEFVVSPKNFKKWITHQALTLNLANIALLVAIIAVSASIISQLDQQRASSIDSQRQIDALRAIIGPATEMAATLESKSDLLASYNRTLDRAVSLGFTNLTGQLSDLQSPSTRASAKLTFLPSDSTNNPNGGTLGLASAPVVWSALTLTRPDHASVISLPVTADGTVLLAGGQYGRRFHLTANVVLKSPTLLCALTWQFSGDVAGTPLANLNYVGLIESTSFTGNGVGIGMVEVPAGGTAQARYIVDPSGGCSLRYSYPITFGVVVEV